MVTVMSVIRKIARRDGECNANVLDKNTIDVGLIILNKKIEVGRKIIDDATPVIGNISGKMKKP